MVLICGMLLFGSMQGVAAAAEENAADFESSGMYVLNNGTISFSYLEDNTLKITDCELTGSGTVEIPEKISEKTVTVIGEAAFYECTALTDITLPDTITTIESGAFYGCTALEQISLPDSVTTLGDSAFYGCTALTVCDFSDALTTIGVECFYGIAGWQVLEFPESLTQVGEMAFGNVANLEQVQIPASVTKLDAYVFEGCHKLRQITVAEENPTYCDMDGVLYNSSKTLLIKYPPAKSDTSFTVPAGVTRLSNWAMIGAANLEEIHLGDVTALGEEAFYGCSKLKTMTLPEGMTEIPYAAFAYCSHLEHIQIPASVTTIGDYAFLACERLQTLTVPATVTEIGEYAIGYNVDTDTAQPVLNRACRVQAEEGSAAMEYIKANGIRQPGNQVLGIILMIAGIVIAIGIGIGVLIYKRNNTIRIAAGPRKGEPVAKQKRRPSK